MLRASLIFAAVAIAALCCCDLELGHTDPAAMLARVGDGLLHPDWSLLWHDGRPDPAILRGLAHTLAFAFAATALGALAGLLLAFHYHRPWVRAPLALIRSVHELFWVLLLGPLLGSTSQVCALFAIALPFTAIFAKVYSEILEEADTRPLQSLPMQSGPGRIFYVLLPMAWNAGRAYTAYRFECALRASVVLGFVGIPTLGYHLKDAFGDSEYAAAAALFYLLLALVATHRLWIRPNLIPLWIVAAFLWIDWSSSLSWSNLTRFLGELVPLPLQRGEWTAMGPWLKQVLFAEAAPGIANALLVTQVSLVLCGLLVVILLPLALPQTAPRPLRFFAKSLFLLMRCIPEYILAFLLMICLGPSMLPAILTVSGHNAGLLAHIMANASAALEPRNAARRALDRYVYDLLPRIYGQILAFLFYRWETMLRESAILGVLGVGTVGFYIQHNIALDRPDRAALLILLAGFTTLGIDLLSSRIRRKLRLSSDFSSGRCGEA
ncbi:MAG: hypothetical protein RL095_1189 [Verrucomicrobiota bacterium]|jgi:phosphonate transport system permease protein